MCQLLGISLNKGAHLANYLSPLISNSPLHPDGWGVSYYPSGCKNAVVFKEPIPGYESQMVPFLSNYPYFTSSIMVAHIRKATRGSLSYDNTHPFTRTYAGRDFAFAHNGTLPRQDKLIQLSFFPKGVTDSERAFCYLLSQLKRGKIRPTGRNGQDGYNTMDFQVIHEILADINLTAAGSFNCVFTDGKYLFCYRDLAEARNLFYLSNQNVNANIQSAKIFASQNLHIFADSKPTSFIAATEPLTEGNWKAFTGGQLIVAKDGEIVANFQ